MNKQVIADLAFQNHQASSIPQNCLRLNEHIYVSSGEFPVAARPLEMIIAGHDSQDIFHEKFILPVESNSVFTAPQNENDSRSNYVNEKVLQVRTDCFRK